MTLLQIILALAPHLSNGAAGEIAKHTLRASSRHGVDPHVVVAIMWRESRMRHRAVGKHHSFGLLQVHVSGTTNRRMRGRERDLFDVRRNIRMGVRQLAMWKRYHERRGCTGHPWFSHWQFGHRVWSAAGGQRVARTLRRVKRMASRRTVVWRR